MSSTFRKVSLLSYAMCLRNVVVPFYQTARCVYASVESNRDRHEDIYLPVVTCRYQLSVCVQHPLPIGVAPGLTEVVPVTEGDIHRDTHDLLLQDLKHGPSLAVG